MIYLHRERASVRVRWQRVGPAGTGPQGRGDSAQLRQVAQAASGSLCRLRPRAYRLRHRFISLLRYLP